MKPIMHANNGRVWFFIQGFDKMEDIHYDNNYGYPIICGTTRGVSFTIDLPELRKQTERWLAPKTASHLKYKEWGVIIRDGWQEDYYITAFDAIIMKTEIEAFLLSRKIVASECIIVEKCQIDGLCENNHCGMTFNDFKEKCCHENDDQSKGVLYRIGDNFAQWYDVKTLERYFINNVK